jgi:ABC-type dipeptide/oligopeptide/nickel transport system permease component
MIRLAPGDPIVSMLGNDYTPQAAAGLRHQLGLDQPLPVQYALWLGRVAHGDLGQSIFTHQPVTEVLGERLPTTIVLSVSATLLAVLIALPMGVAAARWKDSMVDGAIRVLSIAVFSVPVFWLGLMLLTLFAAKLAWFPIGGGFQEEGWGAMVLPTVTLACGFGALIVRMVRSTLVDVLAEDYIRTARSKGLKERTVYVSHALRNALLPVVTVVGLQFGTLLGGAVLTETVFSLPGLGRLLIESVSQRDYTVVQGCVLIISMFFVVTNLAVDLSYAAFDPRVRRG